MNLSAALNAAKQEGHSSKALAAMATEHSAKCSLRYAPSVVRKLKYLSNHVKVGQCIAASATISSGYANNVINRKDIWQQETPD